MSEKTVELKLDRKFYDNVQATLERNPWMGYESTEEFILEAIRRRLEELRELEILNRKREGLKQKLVKK